MRASSVSSQPILEEISLYRKGVRLPREDSATSDIDLMVISDRLTYADLSSGLEEASFDLADNAAHALCLAALRRHGSRGENRYIVFQVLPHTLPLGASSMPHATSYGSAVSGSIGSMNGNR